MNIKQKENFISVAKTLNVTKTAKRSFISQPAMTQKKKELETRVSASLKSKDFKLAKKLCEQLEEIIGKMK